MQTVHVRVNDAATGKPTPCRVRFTDAAGRYYAPLGRCSDFPSNLSSFAEGNVFDGTEEWAYIDGACEIELPAGAIHVAVRKGIEYKPYCTTVDLLPGKLALRFSLERWADWSKQGWYAGDGRVHFGSPHELLLQAAGEDLAVVNLLVEETSAGRTPNIVAFSGQKPCLEMPGHMVVVNTHNVHAELGNLGLLHCHRVVYPLRLGCQGKDDWTLADWCDQCHRKHGLVVWTESPGHESPLLTETLADLVLARIDAFEMTPQMPASQRIWYTLLDAGFHLPLIGSSGSRSNGQVIGRPRTYCQLEPGQTLTYQNWIEAVRAGRTFVTEGPLLRLTVNGHPPGSVIQLAENEKTVHVHAEAHSPVPLESLDIICNGEVIGQAESKDKEIPWNVQLARDVAIADGGWLVAHSRGSGTLLARTSPIYVQVPGREPPTRRPARTIVADSLVELVNRAQKRQPMNKRLLHVLQSACDQLGEPRA